LSSILGLPVFEISANNLSKYLLVILLLVWSVRVAVNGLPLCEGGDFQHYSSLDAQSLNLALHCHRSTKPPLLQNGC
jgi:hypothetical protein